MGATMSTKATLACNLPDFPEDNPNIDRVPPENRDKDCPKFHLFAEVLEEDQAVYLELPGAEFEASQQGITVKIPAKVWNRIIKIGER
jgi:hypothetical protein